MHDRNHNVSGSSYADALNENAAPIPVVDSSRLNDEPNSNQRNSKFVRVKDPNARIQERNKTPITVGKRKEAALALRVVTTTDAERCPIGSTLTLRPTK
ncbi:hypothetical protein JTE90_014116 [Oedothorax gibbosus]|uniref:Uncharacterized protein n=1 Tax=Oedothorax gibbosus TaxID=931172 RepID=A0AAV6V8L3_9ARAC|nr:hypothetical protein JTE90_014116 [Oedothorax gibbosus]